MTSTSNTRASLLSGLRTGGVRSTSSPLANIPHTAAPGGTFNVPRIVSDGRPAHFPEEDADDVAEIPAHNRNFSAGNRMPMTAAVDGALFQQQQMQQMQGQRSMGASSPFDAYAAMQQQQQLQLQFMQMQLNMQAAQYQAEALAKAGRMNNGSNNFQPPATAGPMQSSFGNMEMRRPSRTNLRSSLGGAGDDQVPMTAALGGKFGSRMDRRSGDEDLAMPGTPNHTTVISGGTSLGTPNSAPAPPSKSDTASTWRRGGNNNSALNRLRESPSVRVTPPPAERVSPPPGDNIATPIATKARPMPLRFNAPKDIGVVAVDAESADTTDGDDASSTTSSKSASNSTSSPTTPHSGSSLDVPLSPREEAAKKLYEGLGLGRPAKSPSPSPAPHRVVSQPVRQPRGPPSGMDELGGKNFATRIRRKAIGGLGMLLESRERREIEAF